MRTNFSFSGCGFLGIYHLGVATCIREHAPEMFEDCRIAGASAGSFIACCLLAGCPLGKCTSYTLGLANEANSLPLLGPLHPRFDIVNSLRKALAEVLPADAYLRTSGRLFISLTRWRDWKNVMVSEYASNQELIDAMICSAFVPFYCGLIPPKYKGDYYWDGGLSDNQPVFDEPTIIVSPFSGENDISPVDNSANFIHLNVCNSSVQFTSENLSRISIALFPPNAQKLSDICKQGYDDALRYLQNNGLINCTRHLRITTTIEPPRRDGRVMSVSEKDWENIQREMKLGNTEGCSDCGECKTKVREALSTSLPPQVHDVLQSAMLYNKKSFIKYLRQGKMCKAVYMMVKPWLIPADILFSFLLRCLQCIPQVHQDFDKIIEELPHFINNLFGHQHHKYETKLEYHCAFTEETNYQGDPTDYDLLPSSPAIDINLVMNCESLPQNESFQTSTQLSGSAYDTTTTIYTEQMCKDPVSALNNMRSCNEMQLQEQDGVSNAVIDQFKVWLESANNNDATIAYYYLDVESNTMKVEQIFKIPEDSECLARVPSKRRRNSGFDWQAGYSAQKEAMGDESWKTDHLTPPPSSQSLQGYTVSESAPFATTAPLAAVAASAASTVAAAAMPHRLQLPQVAADNAATVGAAGGVAGGAGCHQMRNRSSNLLRLSPLPPRRFQRRTSLDSGVTTRKYISFDTCLCRRQHHCPHRRLTPPEHRVTKEEVKEEEADDENKEINETEERERKRECEKMSREEEVEEEVEKQQQRLSRQQRLRENLQDSPVNVREASSSNNDNPDGMGVPASSRDYTVDLLTLPQNQPKRNSCPDISKFQSE
ncbi:patanin-like phospholipase domain-containing protein [Argonauta hians]